MAPGGVTRKKKSETNNSQSPLFSSGVRPNPDSPIERGIQGLQKRTKKTHNPSSGPPGFSDEAIEESTEITQNESDESNQNQFPDDASADTGSTSKKRTRGLTMGRNIMKSLQATGSKLKITVDPLIGRPIDTKESAKLASQIGVVTRDVLQVPKRWKDVDKEKDLNVGFDHLNV